MPDLSVKFEQARKIIAEADERLRKTFYRQLTLVDENSNLSWACGQTGNKEKWYIFYHNQPLIESKGITCLKALKRIPALIRHVERRAAELNVELPKDLDELMEANPEIPPTPMPGLTAKE